MKSFTSRVLFALVSLLSATSLRAQTTPATQTVAASEVRNAETWLRDGDRIFVQYSVYTKHWSDNPEHVNRNHMINLAIESNYDRVWGADKTLFGFSQFKHSFGRPSQYLYWGQRWDFNDYVYAKITAGVLHGYKGKYRDKIPFNRYEIAPAIIPSIGVKYKDASVEAIIFGGAGVMVGVGFTF